MNKLYFLQKNIISVSQRLGFCHAIPRVLCENNPVYPARAPSPEVLAAGDRSTGLHVAGGSVIQIFVAAMVLS